MLEEKLNDTIFRTVIIYSMRAGGFFRMIKMCNKNLFSIPDVSRIKKKNWKV
jgi:hypothetical protein